MQFCNNVFPSNHGPAFIPPAIGLPAKSFRNINLTFRVGHGHWPVKKTVTGNFWSCLPVAQWEGVFTWTSKRWRERQISDAVQNESHNDSRWHSAGVVVNHVIYYFFSREDVADSKPKKQQNIRVKTKIWLKRLVDLTSVKVDGWILWGEKKTWIKEINLDGFPKIPAVDRQWAAIFFKFIIWRLAFRCKSMGNRPWEGSISLLNLNPANTPNSFNFLISLSSPSKGFSAIKTK